VNKGVDIRKVSNYDELIQTFRRNFSRPMTTKKWPVSGTVTNYINVPKRLKRILTERRWIT